MVKKRWNFTTIQNLLIVCATLTLLSSSCNNIEKYGRHYKQNRDIKSLENAVALIEIGWDTSCVRQILGEPIDFGFDYRYLSNTKGENGCPMGAVFNIDSCGKISSKNIIEICE